MYVVYVVHLLSGHQKSKSQPVRGGGYEPSSACSNEEPIEILAQSLELVVFVVSVVAGVRLYRNVASSEQRTTSKIGTKTTRSIAFCFVSRPASNTTYSLAVVVTN